MGAAASLREAKEDVKAGRARDYRCLVADPRVDAGQNRPDPPPLGPIVPVEPAPPHGLVKTLGIGLCIQGGLEASVEIDHERPGVLGPADELGFHRRLV